ncbi:MAG: baseplate J/gp47 family protein [Bacillota bacterium]|nr:baseplate J/gp47 family protein [Bacillota bacterium]
MYQFKEFDELMEDMLARVPDAYDKRQGSMIWNALAPVAAELSNAYIALEWMADQANPYTASREGLLVLAINRGLEPEPASAAIYRGQFNISVPAGMRFSRGDLTFQALEAGTGPLVACEQTGTRGNSSLGDIWPVDHLTGLESAKLVELVTPGEEEEDTEAFRTRYLLDLEAQSFGGNIADYRQRVNLIPGVGGVKVTPIWDGPGTVKLTVLSSDLTAPSEELVATIQETVDPLPAGQGYGLAPVGHTVTVEAVEELTINVSMSLTYESGYSWSDVSPEIEEAVEQYFRDLSSIWQNEQQLVVRVTQIESRVLGVIGVLDVSNTKMNGSSANLALQAQQIPALGVISNA